MAIKQIAAEVGLAPSSAHARMRQLRDLGVWRATFADIDPAAFGITLEALFMIGLAKHERSTVDQLLDAMDEIREVRSAFLVTGRYDLMVHVVVRDTEHLKNLAFDEFTSRPGVERLETSIIYEHRLRRELPVFLTEAG